MIVYTGDELKVFNRKTILQNIGIITLSLLLWTSLALAHKSPEGCSGSSLGINLYTSAPQVSIGNTINFSVEIFNGVGSGPVVCDATGITASLVTPDGITHPITLKRTTLTNGQSDSYPNVVTYTARAVDVKADGTLTATALDSGDIHQNDTNSLGSGNQGVNITVIPVPVIVPPATSSSPTPLASPSASVVPTPTPTLPQVTGGGAPATPIPTPTPTVTTGGGGGSYVRPTPTPVVVTATTTPVIITLVPYFPSAGFPPHGEDSSSFIENVFESVKYTALSFVGVLIKALF